MIGAEKVRTSAQVSNPLNSGKPVTYYWRGRDRSLMRTKLLVGWLLVLGYWALLPFYLPPGVNGFNPLVTSA